MTVCPAHPTLRFRRGTTGCASAMLEMILLVDVASGSELPGLSDGSPEPGRAGGFGSPQLVPSAAGVLAAQGSSSLPMIGRRLPASSSFVLAAARLRALQLDPGPHDGTTGQPRGKPQHQAPP
jgi:hypothetical protein